MNHPDIRWKQRYANFDKALTQLAAFFEPEELNPLEEQGLIKAFEYTYELAWNVMKDFLTERGLSDIFGSRDAIRVAFKEGLVEAGDEWMDMIQDRNRSSHSYNQETAQAIHHNIKAVYFGLFQAFHRKMAQYL
ncbi:MAG: nucleotidyltransferase substrate binding protein [Formosimonas sp.]